VYPELVCGTALGKWVETVLLDALTGVLHGVRVHTVQLHNCAAPAPKALCDEDLVIPTMPPILIDDTAMLRCLMRTAWLCGEVLHNEACDALHLDNAVLCAARCTALATACVRNAAVLWSTERPSLADMHAYNTELPPQYCWLLHDVLGAGADPSSVTATHAKLRDMCYGDWKDAAADDVCTAVCVLTGMALHGAVHGLLALQSICEGQVSLQRTSTSASFSGSSSSSSSFGGGHSCSPFARHTVQVLYAAVCIAMGATGERVSVRTSTDDLDDVEESAAASAAGAALPTASCSRSSNARSSLDHGEGQFNRHVRFSLRAVSMFVLKATQVQVPFDEATSSSAHSLQSVLHRVSDCMDDGLGKQLCAVTEAWGYT